jgi:hypothetical protein
MQHHLIRHESRGWLLEREKKGFDFDPSVMKELSDCSDNNQGFSPLMRTHKRQHTSYTISTKVFLFSLHFFFLLFLRFPFVLQGPSNRRRYTGRIDPDVGRLARSMAREVPLPL